MRTRYKLLIWGVCLVTFINLIFILQPLAYQHGMNAVKVEFIFPKNSPELVNTLCLYTSSSLKDVPPSGLTIGNTERDSMVYVLTVSNTERDGMVYVKITGVVRDEWEYLNRFTSEKQHHTAYPVCIFLLGLGFFISLIIVGTGGTE